MAGERERERRELESSASSRPRERRVCHATDLVEGGPDDCELVTNNECIRTAPLDETSF